LKANTSESEVVAKTPGTHECVFICLATGIWFREVCQSRRAGLTRDALINGCGPRSLRYTDIANRRRQIPKPFNNLGRRFMRLYDSCATRLLLVIVNFPVALSRALTIFLSNLLLRYNMAMATQSTIEEVSTHKSA